MIHARTATVIAICVTIETTIACAGGEDGLDAEDAGSPPDATVLPESASLAPEEVPVDASSDALERVRCSPGGFCPVPVPVQAVLTDISGLSVDDVWAAGGDTIIRWDGESWQPVYRYTGSSPRTVTFIGIRTVKKDDGWAIAYGATPSVFYFVHYTKDEGGKLVFRDYSSTLTAPQPPLLGPFFGYRYFTVWAPPASDALWFLHQGNPSPSIYRAREVSNTVVIDTFQTGQIAPARVEGPNRVIPFLKASSIWGFGPNDIYVGGYGLTCPGSASPATCTGPSSYFSVIAHYDGTSWSFTNLSDTGVSGDVTSLYNPYVVTGMFGTTSSTERRLWLRLGDDTSSTFSSAVPGQVLEVPVDENGNIGAPSFVKRVTVDSTCPRFLGTALSPTAAWLSNSCLVYRWDGSGLELTSTSVDGAPAGITNGLWASSADDAWIVGRGLPKNSDITVTGFAARRSKSTAHGEIGP